MSDATGPTSGPGAWRRSRRCRAAGEDPYPGPLRPNPHDRRAPRALGPPRGGRRDRRRGARRRADPAPPPPGQADVRDPARRHSARSSCSSRAPSSVTSAHAAFDDLDLGDWVGVEGAVMKTRKGELSVKVRAFAAPVEGAAPAPGEVARARRRRHPLPPALRRPHRERRRAACVRDPLRGHRDDPTLPGRPALRRGRDAGAARAGRRRGGEAVRHAPQRARDAALVAHRARAAPQASAGRRDGARLRDRARVPQRGAVDASQPRVHDARAATRRSPTTRDIMSLVEELVAECATVGDRLDGRLGRRHRDRPRAAVAAHADDRPDPRRDAGVDVHPSMPVAELEAICDAQRRAARARLGSRASSCSRCTRRPSSPS